MVVTRKEIFENVLQRNRKELEEIQSVVEVIPEIKQEHDVSSRQEHLEESIKHFEVKLLEEIEMEKNFGPEIYIE